MTSKPISVVIPSFNGLALLKEYLPSVEAALGRYAGGGEIIVVEDGGSDGSVEWLAKNHPKVKAVRLEKNVGFAGAANAGVKAASNESVMLLNNDMAVEGDFFEPLVERLDSNEKILSATAMSVIDGKGNESLSVASLEDGVARIEQPGLGSDKVFDKPLTIFHSAGGFSLYRRSAFLELGGFDPIFHPFYWEDVDLSYRAWRKGMMCVYEPRSKLKHRSHGTIGEIHDVDKYDLIQHAHLHLFHLLNMEGEELTAYARGVNRLMSEPNLYSKGVLRRGFYVAMGRLDAAIERRKRSPGGLSLAEVIERSSLAPVGGA